MELPVGLYYVSDFQDYFEHITTKHDLLRIQINLKSTTWTQKCSATSLSTNADTWLYILKVYELNYFA